MMVYKFLKTFSIGLVFCLHFHWSLSQMIRDGQVVYGNEWINPNQEYFKILVSGDGIYRISIEDLTQAGFPISEIPGRHFQLIHFGEEIPIMITNDNELSGGDYLEFYGMQNRGELDSFLYTDPVNSQLNPEYSMYSDTSTYYLSWSEIGTRKRYEIIDNRLSGNLPPKEQFYMHEELLVFSSFNLKPTHNGVDRIRYSSFDTAEGFGSSLLRTHQVAFPTSSIFSAGPSPSISVRFGSNAVNHQAQLQLGSRVLVSKNFANYAVNEFNEFIAIEELNPTTEFTLYGAAQDNDRYVLAHSRLTYPRSFRFLGSNHFIFQVEGELADKYFEITEFRLSTEAPRVYDVTNGYVIQSEVLQDTVRFLMPASNVKRKLVIVDPVSGSKPVHRIEQLHLESSANLEAEFIVISHSRLMDSSIDGSNWVEEYANYRSSPEGGGFTAKVLNIEQLYHLFSYGVRNHPLAIRNFIQYILSTDAGLKYVFIIGKGREYPQVRTNEDLNHPGNIHFYVPTFGVPGSDNLLAAQAGNPVPDVPIGRLAAQSPDDVRFYLDKVKLHENPLEEEHTIEAKQWKKKIVHLSGGTTLIQDLLFEYLNEMAESIETNTFGARVSTFRKTSADPIQAATSQQIIQSINQGVSFITFFGHSAVGTFDFSLEEPGRYDNYGRFPMIISLGCHSGNIHTESAGISEDFVLEENKGSIAFLASSGSAYINPQYLVGRLFYELTGQEMVGQSIGRVIKEVILQLNDPGNIATRTLHEQLTLHGDPSIVIEPFSGPDFTIDFQSVKTTPTIVNTNLDSFELEFDLVNLGRAIQDSLALSIEHKLPDGIIAWEDLIRVKAPYFGNHIFIKIPAVSTGSIGKNSVQIKVDPTNEITELPSPEAELNNDLKNAAGEPGFCFYILDNGAIPVYPPPFGIVGTTDFSLKSSTNNAFLSPQKYIVELDTTELFNSPALWRSEKRQVGGTIEWDPDISFRPNQVYYWRSSPDTSYSQLGFIWENSSFIYLPESGEGWNQSHYFQFLKNQFDGLTLPGSRQLRYDTAGFFISIHNKIYEPQTPPGYQYNFETFAASVRPWDFMRQGVAVAVTDGTTGEGWINQGGDYGSISTNSFSSYRVFGFETETAEQRKILMDFLEDAIPEGNHVYLWTVLGDPGADFNPEAWEGDLTIYGQNLFTILENQGAALVSQLKERGSVPYNIVYIKGNSVLGEDLAITKDAFIKTDVFIPVLDIEGKMNSTIIGPARTWDRAEWNANTIEPGEEFSLDLVAIDQSGNQMDIETHFTGLSYDLGSLNAEEYPYLKLILNSRDSVRRTSPNLNYWRVYYDELPDIALVPENHFLFHADTLAQGDSLNLEVSIENLSTSSLDSILIRVSLLDEENNERVQFIRVQGLDGEESFVFTLQYPTDNLAGSYQLIIELNPGEDQPEKNSFNNFGVLEFFVEKDSKNPLLDVTFDGIHIMDGDIVSRRPLILIELNDDNPHLPIDDLSLFELQLLRPDGSIWNVDNADPSIRFTPASQGEENKASLEFSPELTEGEYKLIVQARDASGNYSGINAFEINFIVIEANGISQILNYPNPFSSSTQFVFTLTGEIPDVLTIRIMTLSGKVVKEITKEELGGLHIGLNRTNYRWDGTDDYGSQLANGIYVYRVIANSENADEYLPISQSTDLFFTKGFGKLVIMR